MRRSEGIVDLCIELSQNKQKPRLAPRENLQNSSI
jgi:hypothetical protein